MKEKVVKIEFQDEDFERPDNKLTNIHKDTLFVIDKDKKVKYIFRKRRENDILNRLVNSGIKIENIRKNRYGDILIIK